MKRDIITTPTVPSRSPTVPRFPTGLDEVLHSRNAGNVVYDKQARLFRYRVRDNEWVRIYGITKMMFHAFWPEYDRNAPVIVKQEHLYRKQHAKLKRRAQKTKRRGGGVRTDADIVRMARAPAGDSKTGADLGELVHMQLVTWAKNRHLGIPLDTAAMVPEWQVHSQNAVDELVRNVGVDARYGEFLIYDPAVPVATAIDLLGWMPPPGAAARRRYMTVNKEPVHITRRRGDPRTVVVIEVKTGSSYNMNLGNAPMHGRTAREMRLVNTPLNQGMTQLAISRAIVEHRYASGDITVLGLLVWVNRAVGARSRWLSPAWEEAGRLMLRELRVHMAERGGKAWTKKKKRPK